MDEAAQARIPEREPVERPGLADDRRDEEATIEHRVGVAGHRALRGIGQEDDDQQVGDADCARLALEDKLKQQEQHEVDGGLARDGLQQRRVRPEDFAPFRGR